MRQYDVIVVGAGMVGAALACALGRADFRVALLEQHPPERFTPDKRDIRVSAVSPASETILSALDAWHSIEQARISPYRSMVVWDAMSSGHIRFEAADVQRAHLGHIIENRLLQTELLNVVNALPEVDFYCPANIRSITVEPHQVKVKTEENHLSAALLVGADGAHSHIREQAGIAVQAWDYGQKAVVATVATEQFHERTAWQRFLPGGSLAFLPLDDGRSSIVWSTLQSEAEQLLAMADTEFCERLGQAFEHRLGRVLNVESRAAFPLHYQHARRFVAERLALVGDAAHVVHPLAGQGVNMGFLDIDELQQCLQAARNRGSDIGGMKTLRRYERARKGENRMMGLALDAIKRLFTSQSSSLIAIREYGLNITDRSDWLKRFFMTQAMGRDSDRF